MPDWVAIVRERLGSAAASNGIEPAVVIELAEHLEDRFDDLRKRGLSDEAALEAAKAELDRSDGLAAEVARRREPVRPLAVAVVPGPAGRFFQLSDFVAAWRGIRGRGWVGAFVVALLAMALASNVVTFAVADSLVFNRDPFPDAARIAIVSNVVRRPDQFEGAQTLALLDAWNRQTDLVAGVGGYLQKTVFLKGTGPLEPIATADVTLALFKALGVAPRWGRDFVSGDERFASAFNVVIGEELARRRFGDPQRALGQTLQATAGPLVVIGVMNSSFSYPNAKYQIWRVVDPLGPLSYGGMNQFVARALPEVPIGEVANRLGERAKVVGAQAGLSTYEGHASPAFASGTRSESAPLLLALLGAAACLLLACCANVASLELAGSVRRAGTYAVQLSLGAGRWRLARIAALEGLLLVGGAVVIAVGMAQLLIGVITPLLPDSLRLRTNNPIDLDGRAMVAMIAVAVAAWLVAALPAVVAASRSSLVSLLKLDARTAAASRGAVLLRRALTAAQVALAVATVIGGLLYARTYQNLLAVEKGFDSRGLFSVSWTMQGDYYESPAAADFGRRATERLKGLPGVEGVTSTPPPPDMGDSAGPAPIEIDNRPPLASKTIVHRRWVSPGYFDVVPLPVKQGRLPDLSDPESDVVVPEVFARRFFDHGAAVGHTFRLQPREPWLRIVGVVGDVRSARTRMPDETDNELYYYDFVKPAPPPAASAPTLPRPHRIDSGGMTRFASRFVRADGRLSEAALLDAARQVDSTLPVTVTSLDRTYAEQNQDTRIASQVVNIFSALAFAMAMAGVYGVMAFLVAGRRREIGIRMSLGADPHAIRRMVLASSARMVIPGVLAGIVLALIASRWLQVLLFGVSPTAIGTYALTAASVAVISLIATWQPASQAARVDPAITLRAE